MSPLTFYGEKSRLKKNKGVTMNKFYALTLMALLSGCVNASEEETKAVPYDPLKMNIFEPYAADVPASAYLPTQQSNVTVKQLDDQEIGSNYNMDLLTQNLRRGLVGSGIQVRTIHHRVQLVIPGNVLFGSNKKTIKSDFTDKLEMIASVLNEYPQTMVKVVGYTGNELSVLKSKSISFEQAQVVVDYLKNQGVSANRLLAEGKGQEDPLTANQTAAGRAKNYRIEINILNLL